MIYITKKGEMKVCKCEKELEQIRELIESIKEQNEILSEEILSELDYLNRALLESEEEEY